MRVGAASVLLVLACVVATPAPSDACTCGGGNLTEAQVVEGSDIAFDGIVLADAPREPPKPCAEPSRGTVRPGCLEIGAFDRTGCAEVATRGHIIHRGPNEEWLGNWETTYAPDGKIIRALVCKIETGTYEINGPSGPRTFAFDAKVGGSVLFTIPRMPNEWRVRIRVDAQIKGDLPREVYLRSSGTWGGGCGIDWGPAPGSRLRFLSVTRFDDGDLGIDSCSGSHEIDDKTAAHPRVVPAARPAASAAPSAPAADAPKKSGCQVTGDAGLAFVLGLLLARRRSRR